ncbi:alpha/beta hydrolase [Telluribacter sp.]|uniref:alpha/beta hydrolase n=1 Tax=Telluribacter sp. TaxID=1978767 RepID=UPI002E0F030D
MKTKEDWQKRQAFVRARLNEAFGPFPPKTPLNPVVTGTVERADFRVEKLYFESQPGYFVTAALFIPKNTSGKSPAILYCSGHHIAGFRSDVYQHTILNYVEKGFIVLAFDPIGQGERRDYRDLEGKSAPTKEHSYAGVQTFITGISPANYFTWDGIRAIDYLISRPEVDASRIGVTGRSGGGTQTAYIAALDERVLASAPECYITSFDKLLLSNGPQDAEQNLLHGIEKGLDLADFIEVRAPKPTLIVSTTRDMFSIQGVRDTYLEARKAFEAFGKAGHLNKVEDDAAHASTPKNREAAFAFFQKYLNNPGNPEDSQVELFPVEDLYVTPEGNIHKHLKGQSLFAMNKKYTQDVLQKRDQRRKKDPTAFKNIRTAAISLSGYKTPPTGGSVIFSGRTARPNYHLEKYLVKGSGDYYVPVLWLKPATSTGKAILFLDDRGKAMAAGTGEWADRLTREGYEVILPDLSGIGELGNGYMKGGDSVIEETPLNLWFMGIQTHQNLVAVRAAEIAILAEFIKMSRVSAGPLVAAASGTLTSDLLHAATFSNPFDRVILLNPLVSYQSIAEERLYKPKFAMSAVAGAIHAYDLPDLVAGLATKNLLLVNPVDATDTEIGQQAIQSAYADALGRQPAVTSWIKYAVKPEDMASTVIAWLK